MTTIRAGCNFSAISGTDSNALRWDQAGYKYLMGLAGSARDSKDAFVQRVESVEYWDEQVPRDKIQHMARYLENVSETGTVHPFQPEQV